MIPYTATKERSAIHRWTNTTLEPNRRNNILAKISANANAPGGCRRQNNGAGSTLPNGRAQQAALQRLAGTLGIYVIETNPTGPLAAQVGGADDATITVESGTPASVTVTDPLHAPTAVTWAAGGTVSLVEQVGAGSQADPITLAGMKRYEVKAP